MSDKNPVPVSNVQKAKFNYIKTIRTAIRLKHSLRADDELRDVLPGYLLAFDKAVMQGKLPPPIDTKALIDGTRD